MKVTKLYLAGNHIPTGVGLGHLQIIAETDSGAFLETEVQIDPTYSFVGNWQFKIAEIHTIPTQGSIGPWDATEFVVTKSFNSPSYYDRVQLNLGDRAAEDVWTVINAAAESISNFSIPYDLFYNSNTFAVTLLDIVGISSSLPNPGPVLGYPGFNLNNASEVLFDNVNICTVFNEWVFCASCGGMILNTTKKCMNEVRLQILRI